MKALAFISRTARAVLWTIMGVALLAAGLVMLLYSPWFQDAIRGKIVSKLNSIPGLEVAMDKFELKFPLKVDIQGLSIVQDGDTMIAAHHAIADVKLLPLLKGDVDVSRAFLAHARYQMGNADSIMQMAITADTVDIDPAIVGLKPLDIDIRKGCIVGGRVVMDSKVDTTVKPATNPDSVAEMKIKVGTLDLVNFAYVMKMQGAIDSLGATVGRGRLDGGLIDMRKQLVQLGGFTGTRLNAAYIAPDSAQIAAAPVAPPSAPSAPWTVTIDSIHFTHSQGLYTTRGVQPQPGLDFAYIQASDMDLKVENFYNQATSIRLPIQLSATERCGLAINANGTFAMDSAAMYIDHFHLLAEGTDLRADGMLGVGDMTTDPSLPMRLTASGNISPQALQLMFPAFDAYLKPLPQGTPILLSAQVDGTAGNLNVKDLSVNVARVASLRASGRVADMFSARGPQGSVKLGGSIVNVDKIMASLAAGTGITVPPMTLDGRLSLRGNEADGKLSATALGGHLALDASLNKRSEGYDIELNANKFPVQAFMRSLGVGHVTAYVQAKGHGFDFFAPTTALDAHAKITSLEYGGYDYDGITLDATLAQGQASVQARADNPALLADIDAHGNLDGSTYVWTVDVEGKRIDLQQMKMSETPANVVISLTASATATPKTHDIHADVLLKNLVYEHQTGEVSVANVKADFVTTDSTTTASVTNRDLALNAFVPCGLDTIMARFDEVSQRLDSQLARHQVALDSLQKALPPFDIKFVAGPSNALNDVLIDNRMHIGSIKLNLRNDSVLSLRAKALNLRTTSANVDTVAMKLVQEGSTIHLQAKMDNKPGTLDDFAHVRLDAIATPGQITLKARQRNIKQQTGFEFGAVTTFADSTATLRLSPLTPIIGYKPWTVNDDNFISYNFPHKKIAANLSMSGQKSSLEITSAATEDPNETDLKVKLADVHIADWIVMNPWAPPIAGDAQADLRLQWNGVDEINANGTVGLTDFTYGKKRVGTFLSDINVVTNASGSINAMADLQIDGAQVMTLAGALNDSTATSPLNLDMRMIHFPLAVANPFMPAGTIALKGVLNGNMDVSGTGTKPLINGELAFDGAAVNLAMTGTDYAFSSVSIPVQDNVVHFTDFGISGANANPLRINGTVDVSDFANAKVDIAMRADNMMLVNTNRLPRGADIFGKAYVNLDATAKGNMRFMAVNANLALLTGSNVTYALSDAQTMMGPSQSTANLVKFVNFNDTIAVFKADSISNSELMLALDATLTIQNGVTITCDLSTTNRDKVEVQPQGAVNFTMSPLSDGRLTGRIDINGGLARYTIPVIGQEKRFTFDAGSYIAFNGDMLNPVLNIHATDEVRTNVTSEGQNSRLVNFDILLGVTGTLDQMDVKFDLTTNDDLTVANELQGMTAEQRANQAMNLLLYNMYTGPGTKASANLGVNPLFNFLESQVNNWAANNIKGVDISFGIDQYNQTTNGTSQQTMNYSYQVSKSLFNDRFKIVVGGNYSTDENSDENLSQNLINDISFEYYLNKKRTMLLRLFRHTGYESILEGEVTQTGVGFVYKKRLSRLSDMLPRFMRPKRHVYTEADRPK